MAKLRQRYSRLTFIIIEDSLSLNAPHIQELKRHNLRFILGVKSGDHTYLFEHIRQADETGQTNRFEIEKDGVIHRFCFMNDVPLNESNAIAFGFHVERMIIHDT